MLNKITPTPLTPAQVGNRGAGLSLLENGQDLAVTESGRLHVELPRVVWEKILLLATVDFRGDYRTIGLAGGHRAPMYQLQALPAAMGCHAAEPGCLR